MRSVCRGLPPRCAGSRGVPKGIQRGAVLAVVLLAGCGIFRSTREDVERVERVPGRRAILISFDALNEARALSTVPPEAIPAFRSLFANAACASSARPAFPSVTAPGHAALWTGSYGNVNGVSANAQPRLPRREHTVLSSVSGYFAESLRAEPLWISAGRAGVRVAGHHVTQGPQPPSYFGTDGPDASLDAARDVAVRTLQQPNVLVMNGYNVLVAPSMMVTERDAAPTRVVPGSWRGTERLTSGVPLKEIAWMAGDDTLHALLYGTTGYDRMIISPDRDVMRGTEVRVAPEETRPISADRPLAEHFAPAVLVYTTRGPVALTARLFSMAADGSQFELLIPELRLIDVNHAAQGDAYLRAIGGWYGNGALSLYRAGRLGTTVLRGGDGRAERRYLESLELVTRQFMRGTEWMWRERSPELLLDYFPLIDEIDHEWFGLVDTTARRMSRGLGSQIQPYRVMAWQLADLRLATLQRLVAADRGAALIVSGDHGMRSYWKGFRPNVALRNAGLLALDANGRVDLARTRAYSPNGYYVMVNRSAWRGGIVPPSEERGVIDAVEQALLAVRDSSGVHVVTRTWRSDMPGADTLGIGGPAGGDVYYDVATGYFWNAGLTGPTTASLSSPIATHGYPSVLPEMHTVLCMQGPAIAPRRVGELRSADAALVTSDWLGVPRPMHATGRSPYRSLVGPLPPTR